MHASRLMRIGLLVLVAAGSGSDLGCLPLWPLDALAASSESAGSTPLPQYRPRQAPSPRARIGGQIRGSEKETPTLIALVPDHIGFTLKSNPALCWYMAGQTSQAVLFTIVDARGIHPLVEQALPQPPHTGLQCVTLHDYGIDLKEQEPYRWFVTLVVDPGRPSRDVVAGGMIERIPFDEACVLSMPCSGGGCEREAIYQFAESGLWYDAIGCLLELLQRNGERAALETMLDSLLRQAGVHLPPSYHSLSK